MGLKKAFDDAEKRGETRCSVCLSAVHSKEYHENAAQAPLATAPPEQADQLVERWEQIAEDGEGTPATDNFYFRCAMERCAAELKATFRATPEQAALYHCTYCDGNHNEKDCPQCGVPDQPQAVSGGALNVEQVKSCFPATSTTQSDAEWWTICTGNLNAALAAHDQKVRREVLEEAA